MSLNNYKFYINCIKEALLNHDDIHIKDYYLEDGTKFGTRCSYLEMGFTIQKQFEKTPLLLFHLYDRRSLYGPIQPQSVTHPPVDLIQIHPKPHQTIEILIH